LKAALQLLDDHALRNDAAAKGRLFALNNYDVRHVADRFETVFNYAIKARISGKEI